jgi:PIN domain nuclease of toxin-antitoxin system
MGFHEVILLDTHAAIWLTTASEFLGKRSHKMISQALAEDRVSVSAITFWEIALLIAKRRLRSLESAAAQRAKILSTGIREIPVTGNIAILAVELDGLHGDPSDRFIVATAIAHDATLVTADDALLGWRHGLRRQDAAR